jgi:hypothetical protein
MLWLCLQCSKLDCPDVYTCLAVISCDRIHGRQKMSGAHQAQNLA